MEMLKSYLNRKTRMCVLVWRSDGLGHTTGVSMSIDPSLLNAYFE